MKILLVEDDIMLNEMIWEYITSTGHLIKSVKNGKDALEVLEKEELEFEIIELDEDEEEIKIIYDEEVANEKSN